MDAEPWPTLGPQLVQFVEERSIFGPGSLKGQPYRCDVDFKALLYRAYEVYPRGHRLAGRRRFKRVGYSVRKGVSKTEKLAQVSYVELHPDAPVRCDGWDARGNPVGRPVRDPYIPILSVTVEQVEELAYGALFVIVTEGPDADLFDANLDRIVRLDEWGRADGKAVALANNPGARDGARTTFQAFDEPHRLFLPRALEAHETMVANLEKRVLEDPWGMYVGTAGELGQGSVAEGLHTEAEAIARGDITDPALCYVHRDASPGWDLRRLDQRIEAIREASGSVPEYGPGQFESIARQWDRPQADRDYLERVWLNRWVKSGQQAFDVKRWKTLTANPMGGKPFVTIGFDGARFRDSTGIVVTDIPSGVQRLWAVWEKPVDLDPDESRQWEIPEHEVNQVVDDIFGECVVWKMYGDPPYWTEPLARWAGAHPDQVEEWWTNNVRRMAWAVREYQQAIRSGEVTHEIGRNPSLEDTFERHIANAGRNLVNHFTDQGEQLVTLRKIHPDRKFDVGMAAVISWRARNDAVAAGAKPPRPEKVGYRPRTLISGGIPRAGSSLSLSFGESESDKSQKMSFEVS